MNTRIALTIAGSDPSGGAGIQADLKTFHQLGVYGTAVVTLLTVQNTQTVKKVQLVTADMITAQLDAVLEDMTPHAAKTGALGSAEIIRAVGRKAATFTFPLVVDPVMISKHGASLIEKEARCVLVECLLPHAFLVTPNLHEAEALAELPVTDLRSMRLAAEKIAKCGAQAVLIKGGHLAGEAVDQLFWRGDFLQYSKPRINTIHTHGTGCTYSAAITALLAKGFDLPDAVAIGKKFITNAIRTHPSIGKGIGPVNHHASAEDEP